MTEDRLSQKGRDEPEYLKPRSSSQVAPSVALYPLNGVRVCPRIEPLTMVVLDTRSSCRQGTEMGELTSLVVHKLTSVESAGQRHWGGPRNTDIKDHVDETRGNIQTRFLHLVMPLRRASFGGSGGFKPKMVGPGEKLSSPQT